MKFSIDRVTNMYSSMVKPPIVVLSDAGEETADPRLQYVEVQSEVWDVNKQMNVVERKHVWMIEINGCDELMGLTEGECCAVHVSQDRSSKWLPPYRNMPHILIADEWIY